MQSIWFSVFELVGAPRFELGTPGPPECGAHSTSAHPFNALADLAHGALGLFRGLCDALHGVGDFAVEHMRIARGGLDAAVVARPLYQLEVASLAQQLGREVVSVVVEAKAGDARPRAQPPPRGLDAGIGEGIAPALHAAIAGTLGDIGEYGQGMVPAQWPEDFADRARDRHRLQLPTLAGLPDLPRVPVDFRPR